MGGGGDPHLKVHITHHASMRARQRMRRQKRTLFDGAGVDMGWVEWLELVVRTAVADADPEKFIASSSGVVRLKFHGVDLVLVARRGGPVLVTIY